MKKKIHITLVGGQTMPVYLGIVETKADSIVLVHSDNTMLQAKQIASEYETETILHCFDPVDMNTINDGVEKLLSEYRDDEVSINLTSGTKPWAIAFALKSQGMSNVTLLYVDQNCMFYDYTHDRKWLSDIEFGINTLMRYNGQIPIKHTLLSDYTDEDSQTVDDIKHLRSINPSDFNQLTIPDNKTWRSQYENKPKGSYMIKDGSYIEWNKPLHEVSISIKRWNHYETIDLNSQHCIQLVFHAGWFEYEIAQMLGKWSKAKNVWMNIVFPYKHGNPKNEIDIVVSTGVKLLMVECKTQIHDNTDIDKFHTAVKNYGGMGSKALFITESPMNALAKEKCSDSQIITFSLKDYHTKSEAQKKLFRVLDKELLNINPK